MQIENCFRYDHLAHCIAKLLVDQPRKHENDKENQLIFVFVQEDGADIFEDVSKTIKSEATRPQQDTLRDRPAQDTEHILATEQKSLFEKVDNAEELDDEALQSPLPFILEQAYYFEQSGTGIGKDEAYR